MLGRTLGHYRILEKLGAGGMGEVYRARDEKLERDVALKVLQAASFSDPAARSRLLREARAAAGLNHSHICTIHEVGEADGQAYIAMELVAGQSLSERLAAGPMTPDEVLRCGLQLAEALAHAHERGIVHRDLKSANVMLAPEGRVKVLDFGLAKRMSGTELAEAATRTQTALTLPGEVVGTLAYMAPEQLCGRPADTRSDIWALGTVLYEMAAGRRPFRGETSYSLTAAILREPPPPLPASVPAELQAVIARCMEREPERRYQRGAEVRAAVEAIQRGVAAPSVGWRGRLARRRGLLAAAALAAVALVAVGTNLRGLRDRILGGAAAPGIDSLAVLPLENFSGDAEQDYFSDGMTEALISELSKISALKVISRTSAMRYKNTDKPMRQIARELDVAGLIEGSVAREADQVRITVQLIHGRADQRLWGDSYQREMRGILALQSEVARAIARAIQVAITPAEQARLASARSVSPEAYELYVLGRHHWNQRTMRGYQQAVDAFRRALEQDPGYAPAHVGLADSYMLLGEQGGMSQEEARSLAEDATRKALELDSTLGEAHSALGWWRFHYEWNWTESEQAFRRAVELNPGDGVARARYGRTLGYLGRFEAAIRELERARELDPLTAPVSAYLGQVYLFAKQYDRAAEQLRRAAEINPDHALIRHNLGELYLAQGRFAEAIPELERSVDLSGQSFGGVASSHYVALLGCAYARGNRREEAIKILRELEERSRRGLVSGYNIASLQMALGDPDAALSWLERAYEQRDTWLAELKAWPWFDSLRDDQRFQDLLRRMNFPS